MLLTNYDLYDLHRALLNIRVSPLSKVNADVVRILREVIDEKQIGNVLEDNIIRRRLSEIAFEDSQLWDWVNVNNVYTYGLSIIKSEKIYCFLSAVLEELALCIDSGNEERIFDCTDALHNVPIVFAEGKNHKRSVKNMIKTYSLKWNRQF